MYETHPLGQFFKLIGNNLSFFGLWRVGAMIESSANRRLSIFHPREMLPRLLPPFFLLQKLLYLCQLRPRCTEMSHGKMCYYFKHCQLSDTETVYLST
jgi:hypothetical protein